jgi:predicted nucleotidyltransferase
LLPNQERMNYASRLDLLLQTLREHQSDLMAAGVRHAEIFGSFARRQATESSDVDILVDLDPDARVNIFDFVGIEMQLSDLLKRRVDLVSRRGLKPGRHENIAAEAIAAF